MTVSSYKKSVVAVIGALVTIAAIYGFESDPELIAAITTLLTAAGVWFFPNS